MWVASTGFKGTSILKRSSLDVSTNWKYFRYVFIHIIEIKEDSLKQFAQKLHNKTVSGVGNTKHTAGSSLWLTD